jgi:hypothetical protein
LVSQAKLLELIEEGRCYNKQRRIPWNVTVYANENLEKQNLKIRAVDKALLML